MDNKFPSIPPGRKRFKEIYVKGIFVFLGNALAFAAKIDPRIKREVETLSDGFVMVMAVHPQGPLHPQSPRMSLKKINGRLKYTGKTYEDGDLVFTFKNIEAAFLVTTPQRTLEQAFAEKRVTVKGDLTVAVNVTRAMNVLLGYMLWEQMVNKVSALG